MIGIDDFISRANFNKDGLIAAIAQDVKTGSVLMLAWMNAETLRESLEKGEMVYYSRSRQKRWHKGESSGHIQRICSLILDCDGDAVLAKVEQIGGIACHTGRLSCFYLQYSDEGVFENSPVIKPSELIYGDSST